MPTYTTDPVTGIEIPTTGSDPGPDYADRISAALLALAHLTHTGASNQDGYQIPAAGINFNADISAQNNDLTNLRSTRYSNQGSTLGGAGDVNCLYFKDGNAYINNGSGTPVQLTAGSSLNSSADNNFPTLEISSNHTINAVDVDVAFNCDVSGGALAVTLPLASEVPAGRFYFVKDKTGSSDGYNISIQPNGTDTIDQGSTYKIADKRGAVLLVSDGVDNWQLFKFTNQLPNNVMLKGLNAAGNAYQNLIGVDGNNQTKLSQNTSFTRFHGGLRVENKPISSASYTVDTTTKDLVLLVDSSGTTVDITLPTAEYDARMIIIKDVGGAAATNNITLVRPGSENIEGLAADYVITQNFASVTLVSDSNGDWWLI